MKKIILKKLTDDINEKRYSFSLWNFSWLRLNKIENSEEKNAQSWKTSFASNDNVDASGKNLFIKNIIKRFE